MITDKKAFSRKLLAIVLSVVMLLSLMPAGLITAFAEPDDSPTPVTVDFTVTLKCGSEAVSGATVKIGDEEKTSDSDGKTSFSLTEGTYTFSVTAEGYVTQTNDSFAVASSDTNFDIEMTKKTVSTFKIKLDNSAGDLAADKLTVVFDGKTVASSGTEGSSIVYSAEIYDEAGDHTYSVTVNDPTLSKKYANISEKSVHVNGGGEEASETLSVRNYTVKLVNGGESESTHPYEYNYTINLPDHALSGYKLIALSVNGTRHDLAETDTAYAFNVEGDTTVTFIYEYSVTVSYDESKGSVTVNGDPVVSGGIVKLEKGTAAHYVVTPDAGYDCTVKANGVTVERSGDIYSGSSLSVEFTEIRPDVSLQLNNSSEKQGSAKVSFTDADSNTVSAAVASGDGSMSVTAKYGLAQLSGSGYTLKFTIDELAEHYKIVYNGTDYAKGDTITVGADKTGKTVKLYVTPVDYTITYNDPLGVTDDDKVFTENKNIESGEITLHSGTAKTGYIFKGWSETVPDGTIKTGVTSIDGGISENKTFYAVYTIDDIAVSAASTTPYNNDAAVSYDSVSAISGAWFSRDVAFTLASPAADATVSYTYGSASGSAVGTVNYTVAALESGTKSLSADQSAEFTLAGNNFKYVAENIATVSVNIDISAPTLTASRGDGVDNLTWGDVGGSGAWKLEYTIIDPEDAKYAPLFAEEDYSDFMTGLKSNLRAETWSLLETVDGSTENPFGVGNNLEGKFVEYRLVDKAGNDVYSYLDHTIPEITNVKWSYSDNNASYTNVNSGDIYSTGEITVNMTVKDKILARIDPNEQSSYKYTGAKLEIYDKQTGELLKTVALTDSAAKTSFFYDKWDCSFTIPVSDDITDRSLTFAIKAEDQAGNNAVPYAFAGELAIVTKAPVISVVYSNADRDGSHDGVVGSDPIYSNDKIIASVTVSETFFGVDGASADVYLNGSKLSGVSWNKAMDSWTADVTLNSEGENIITVTAESQVGIPAAQYDSGKLIIDKTAPEVHLTYTYTDVDGSHTVVDPASDDKIFNKSGSDITVDISISDAYLDPVVSGYVSTVLADGTPVTVTWTTQTATSLVGSYTLTSDEGVHTFGISGKDKAGNEFAAKNDLLISDATPLNVTSISLDLVNTGALAQVVNVLSFRRFFNAKVRLTVGVNDGLAPTSSGVYSLTVKYLDDLGEEKTEELTDFTVKDDGNSYFSIDLPVRAKDKAAVDYWRNGIAISTLDKVGNATEEKYLYEFMGLGGNHDDSDNIVLETVPPVISSVTIPDSSAGSDTVFIDKDNNNNFRYWLLAEESFVIKVFDEEDNDTGLGAVTIEVNNADLRWIHDDMAGIPSYETTISYSDFAKGENTVKVMAMDLAGNVSERTYTVYKDETESTITFSPSDPVHEKDGKLWYQSAENAEIKISVTDKEKENEDALFSGIRSIKTTIFNAEHPDGAEIPNATFSFLVGKPIVPEKVFSINLGDIGLVAEGENEIIVETVDNVGNKNSDKCFVYIDLTAPVITSVDMERVDGNKVLRFLTFGTFFNDKVRLTVGVTDHNDTNASIYSGVKSVNFFFKDQSGEDVVLLGDYVKSEATVDYYVVELPVIAEGDSLEYWRSALSIGAFDNVDNELAAATVSSIAEKVSGSDFLNPDVIYDTVGPEISASSPADGSEGGYDDGVVYSDKAGTYWMLKDKAFGIRVADSGDNSGLYTVAVSDNGLDMPQYAYTDKAGVSSYSTAIVYSDLSEGKNEIKVVAEDVAGNVTEKVFTVYKDTTAAGISISTSDPEYLAGSDRWYIEKAAFTVALSDVGEANTDKSGIASVKTTVSNTKHSGAVINEATAVESGEYITDKTYTFDLAASGLGAEGRNTVRVEVVDNIGNISSAEYVIYIDLTAPVIKSVNMELVNGSKVLRFLTFGTFFNDKVTLTVGVTDWNETNALLNSGMKSLTCSYADPEGEMVDMVNTEYTGPDESYIVYYKFDLPVLDEKDPIGYWEKLLSLSAVDNVGNILADTPISEVYTAADNRFSSSRVLYETFKPNVYTSLTAGEDGSYDPSVLFTDGNSFWVLKDKTFGVTVADDQTETENSGLYRVTIYNNGEEMPQYGYTLPSGANSPIFTYTVRIAYDDLTDGENVIRVTGDDISGNIYNVTYTVYKDSVPAGITRIVIGDKADNNLPFGNFYNDDTFVSLDIRDAEFTSGIKSVNAWYVKEDSSTELARTEGDPEFDVNALTEGERNIGVTFDIPAEFGTAGYLRVVIVDNVGNVFEFGKDSEIPAASNISINSISFDNEPIEISESHAAPAFECLENLAAEGEEENICHKLWYGSSDVRVTVSLNDPGVIKSGIRSITTRLNGQVVSEATRRENAELDVSDSYTFNFKDILSGEGKNAALEGKNVVTVDVVDNAGTPSSATYDLFYIDLDSPAITAFTFSGTNGGKEDKIEREPNYHETDYGYAFDEDITVRVYAFDPLATGGVSTIYFAAIPVDESEGVRSDSSTAAKTYCLAESEEATGIESSAEFTVKAGFKGQIYAYVKDNVGHISLDEANGESVSDPETWNHARGSIIETPAEHLSRGETDTHTSIDVSKTNYVRDLANGTPLYSGDAYARLTVSDMYAGIKHIEATVISTYDTGNNADYSATFSYGGSPARIAASPTYSVGDVVSGWTVDSTEINKVNSVHRDIVIPNNSNDIVITLKLTDHSGNTSISTYTLNIDKDAPIIEVSYAPASEGDDAEYTGYFKEDRVLTVKITERNFDQNLVNITSTINGSGYGLIPSFDNGTLVSSNTTGTENYTYTMTHTFHEDGDYTFAIEASDLAGNKTSDDAVNYGSAADREVAKTFTIDETLPVISVDISGNKGKDVYYQGNVTVTVTIVEHNYAAERYNITITMMDSQSGATVGASAPGASFSENGDTHTYTYVFSEEYRSRIPAVSVTDKAGNLTETHSGSYAGEDFVVDQTNPVIELFKQDGVTPLDRTASNEEDFSVVIRITDTNVDPSNYTIVLTGANNSTVVLGRGDYTYSVDSNSPGVVYITFNAFAVKEQIDDIYSISVQTEDMAGYTSSSGATFSVNRYGSTFMVTPDTKELVSDYYTNAEREVGIIQINAAEVKDQRVSLTHDSETKDLVNDVNYSIVANIPSESNTTDSSWYEYRYTVNSPNFSDEGRYSVTIYSTDLANNSLNSVHTKRTINLFEGESRSDKASLVADSSLDAPVEFQIDKTAPMAHVIGTEKGQYFEGSHEFSISASDDVKLDHVALYVDGDLKEDYSAETVDAGDAKYTLTNSTNDKQQLRLVAYDKAGNIYDTDEQDTDDVLSVQVTRNIFKWYLENTIAKIVSVVVLAGAVILVVLLLRRKKNKEKA